MAQFFEDFSGRTIGQNLFANGFSINMGSATFEVADEAGTNVGQVSSVTQSNACISMDAVGVVADVEVYALVKIPSGYGFWPAVYGRVSGGVSNENRYGAYSNNSNDNINLQKWVGDAFTNWDTVGLPTAIASGDVWNALLRINGTTIQAKFWEDGTTEPATWQVTQNDSDLANGLAGLLFGATGTYTIYKMGVGTAGSAAPRVSPSGDTEAPSVPTGLTDTNKTQTSVSLSWNPSTDDVGVEGYEVFVDDVFDKTETGTATVVTGLAASTPYDFKVRAFDAVPNKSGFSTEITVTTDAAGTGGSPPVVSIGAVPSPTEGQSFSVTVTITDADGDLTAPQASDAVLT